MLFKGKASKPRRYVKHNKRIPPTLDEYEVPGWPKTKSRNVHDYPSFSDDSALMRPKFSGKSKVFISIPKENSAYINIFLSVASRKGLWPNKNALVFNERRTSSFFLLFTCGRMPKVYEMKFFGTTF